MTATDWFVQPPPPRAADGGGGGKMNVVLFSKIVALTVSKVRTISKTSIRMHVVHHIKYNFRPLSHICKAEEQCSTHLMLFYYDVSGEVV